MIAPEIMDMLWAQKSPLLFVTREQFEAALDGWEADPREVDGVIAFIWLNKGPELHFAGMNTGRSMPKSMLRDVLQRIIDRHGYVVVKTPKADCRQQTFNRTIGFRQIGEDEHDVHFRLERFGGNRCQS